MVGYSYSHTQKGPIHWYCGAAAVLMTVLAFNASPDSLWRWALLGTSVFSGIAGLCLMSLTVTDEGKALSISFGPLPFIRKRIAYAKVTNVAVAPNVTESWGVQYIPGHDATYNLYGRECVELQLRNSTACIRVGTDDADGLARLIRHRIHG